MSAENPRYHIQAWGSDEYPDLNYFADEYPSDLTWKYPSVSCALLVPITHSMLLKALDEKKDASP